MSARDNEAWLRDLNGDRRHQATALSDLRVALLRRLRGALGGRARVDDAFLQDAVQDALVRIVERLPQFEGRSRFLTWATSIAIRCALTELRRRYWKDVSLDTLTDDADFVLPATPDSDHRLSQSREMVEMMYRTIHNELTDRQRKALLAELHGMPLSEIARRLGSNPNAVYKLTHDARRRLKRRLEAAGYRAGSRPEVIGEYDHP